MEEEAHQHEYGEDALLFPEPAQMAAPPEDGREGNPDTTVKVIEGKRQAIEPGMPFEVIKVGTTYYVEKPDKTLVPWLSEPSCPHGQPYNQCGACVAAVVMRRFVLDRQQDVTGISGKGIILYGVEWYQESVIGGPVDVYWLKTQTTGQYPSMEVFRQTHCYNNNAQVVYLD